MLLLLAYVFYMHVTITMHIMNIVNINSIYDYIALQIMNVVHIISMNVSIAAHIINCINCVGYACDYYYAYD